MAFPQYMRTEALKRVGFKCEVCGKSWNEGWLLECHHIIPTSNGGKNTYDNLRVLCTEHHLKAHQELRRKNLDHPNSVHLIKARLVVTGGRTKEWLEKNRNGFQPNLL